MITELQYEYEYDLHEINTTEFMLSIAHQRKDLIQRYGYVYSLDIIARSY